MFDALIQKRDGCVISKETKNALSPMLRLIIKTYRRWLALGVTEMHMLNINWDYKSKTSIVG